MIRDYFLIIFRVFGGWFLYVLGIRSKLYYASVYLFSKQSFRLPQSAGKDRTIIIKSYLKTLKMLFKPDEGMKKLSQGKIGVLDSTFKGMNDRVKYLKFYNVETSYFFSREDLNGNTGIISKILGFAMLTKLFFFFWPASFVRNRTNYALMLRESVEWLNILSYCKKNGIKEMYVFSIYEKDSNFLSVLLMKKGIRVSKITSEVPVSFANKIIITDNLFLCFNYQMEEVKALPETLFYEKAETWMPEMQMNYLEQYNGKDIQLPANVIGFYSGACWLRKKLDHTILESIGSYDAEEKILMNVLEYIKTNSNLKLIIFLHPLEKRDKNNLNDAMNYYYSILRPEMRSRVEFYPVDIPAVLAFDKINLGVSLFSTIMFERLSLGFKCILNPVDKSDFPIVGSPFRNICAYSKEELFNKLDKNVSLSRDEFFKINGIENYVSKDAGVKYVLV